MLEIKNLTKTYPNGKKAVSNLSMTIEDGDLFGFIGKNGAGKTTTLKACLTIHDFDSAGNANSTLPKAVVVFGIPLICALLNLISGFSLIKKKEPKIFMYYIIPVIAIIVAVVVLILSL